jgi:hypothetical protein
MITFPSDLYVRRRILKAKRAGPLPCVGGRDHDASIWTLANRLMGSPEMGQRAAEMPYVHIPTFLS